MGFQQNRWPLDSISDDSSLILAKIASGLPGVTPALAATMVEAACVCLHRNGHATTVALILDGDSEREFLLTWETPTPQCINSHNDKDEAAEYGAYAISFMIVLKMTKYTIIRKSRKGTRVDWFLAQKDTLFQDAAQLEVSGLMSGTPDQFTSRVRQKNKQVSGAEKTLPAYVSVTNFGEPRTRLMKHR